MIPPENSVTMIPMMRLIVMNPYLLTIATIGWIVIIINHFKIQYKIQNHIHYWNTCRNATNQELIDWYTGAIDPRWSNLNPRWNNAIIKEYRKRGLFQTLSQGR